MSSSVRSGSSLPLRQNTDSVSFFALTKFWKESPVSSSQRAKKRTHRVFRGTHRVCRNNAVSSFFRNSGKKKTKGQQLKGKIVSEFSHFFVLFHALFTPFPPGFSPSKQRALAQGEQKRRKDKKKNGTNRCSTLVVACLPSS